MINNGSKVVRVHDGFGEAGNLLLRFAEMPKSIMHVQDEVLNQKLGPSDTSAAKNLSDTRSEAEKAAVENERGAINKLHQVKLELKEFERCQKAQIVKFSGKIQAIQSKIEEMKLTCQFKLVKQDTKWRQEMAKLSQAKTAAEIEASEGALEDTQRLLRNSACQRLIYQLQNGQTIGSVKCAIEAGGGKSIETCAHCATSFRGFGMYSKYPGSCILLGMLTRCVVHYLPRL
jgi:hypothetical protein